ncbi:MAG: hypothetical protein HYS27_16110 [Deltaproteobacteria bacterium]|nr:hypothetical protein [Deltaproteobacteria bacterium]
MVNALAVLLVAGGARAGPEASLLAGYAFRSAADGRAHGAAASLGVDVPLAGPLSLRPEGLLLGFGGSATTPASLGLFGGALSLAYRFDDTDARALAALGPLGGVSADGATVAVRAGALVSLGLRFPVLPALALEARVALPLVLWGPRGLALPGAPTFDDGTANDLPLQTTFTIGVAADPVLLFAEPASER